MKSVLQIKLVIIVSVFLLGLLIFKGLQNETVFKYTLGIIAKTYHNNITENTDPPVISIVKTDNPYTTLEEANFIHWDVKFYKYMAENGYGEIDSWPGIGTYAFSPLFPFIWKITHLPARYMVILNYLMFAFSLVILSSLFLSFEEFSKVDHLCLFTLALTLPSVFSFYIPYCESTFMLTLSIAIWALFKNKLWLFYLCMVLFALSRPSYLIVGLAFICTDIYFLSLNRAPRLFVKELIVKLLPIMVGMIITFYLQYLRSGSFFKMFEVHSLFWDHNFQIPKTITDWSMESYGMNIFSIFCIAVPAGLLLLVNWLKQWKVKLNPPVSLFSPMTRKEYLFYLSTIYFIGNFLFVFLTQGGNLNGLHRYILVSPFFYIFLFILASKIKAFDWNTQLKVLIPMVCMGILLLVRGPYQHGITFLDMGFFFLGFALIYLIYFNQMNLKVKIRVLGLLVFLNTVWLTYLFNHFLNNSYIIA